MSDDASTVDESLAVSRLLQIDVICQRFETAWRAASTSGPPPCVEEFLAGSDDVILPALLRQLVLLDVEYRQLRGEQPSTDEYHARFPALGQAWLDEVLSAPTVTMADRYRLLELIESGGQGDVYRAYHVTLDRDVVVKVLKEEHQGRPELDRRFVDEARIQARLQHPGIVPVYEMARADDGQRFLVMKVVEGRCLDEHLRGCY
jgi:serine/threonine-protein kinase